MPLPGAEAVGYHGTVIYQVVPREASEEFFQRLVDHYRDDPNVVVIRDRRRGERRRRGVAKDGAVREQRRLRDRRRRRVVGELPAIETVGE